MKKIISMFVGGAIIMAIKGCFFARTKTVNTTDSQKNATSMHDLSINALNGKTSINFKDYAGKKILIVNTASECGFTPQYKQLQALSETYKDKLVVIGVPCNQFGGQEPGSGDQIATFCEKNFGVTFTLTEKADVKGANQHPIFNWLTSKAKNGVLDSDVSWNFCKYLLNEKGELLGFFPSTVKPDDTKITSLI